VELDGAPHFAANVDEYETLRTDYLEKAGLKVIRFENKDVKGNIEFVLETIKRNLQPI
jgi:very-short-patch-repair endonuclease